MHAALLIPDAKRWTIALAGDEPTVETIDRPSDADDAQMVAAVHDWLVDHQAPSTAIVLALPSSRCLSARMMTDDLERGNRRQALSFRLEEHLPIAAEQFVADYIETGSTALGVCIEAEPIEPIVRALEDAGFAVHHIVPLSLLVAAEVAEADRTIEAVLVGSLGESGQSVDVIELLDGKPMNWQWFVDAGDEFRVAMQALAAQADGRVRLAVVGDGAVHDAIQGDDRFECIAQLPNTREAAVSAAAKLIDGRTVAWCDLRRDALARPDRYDTYRKPAAVLIAGVVLLLACVIGITQYRASRYAQMVGNLDAQQIELFKGTLPDQRVPVNIKSRLQSEARKLAGLSGQATGRGDLASLRSTSALVHLHALLASAPADLRFRILDLSIDPSEIRVSGEARSHGDAERITAALRDTGRYDVDPPRTQALRDQGVSFTFTAKPIEEADLARAGRP